MIVMIDNVIVIITINGTAYIIPVSYYYYYNTFHYNHIKNINTHKELSQE